MYSSLSHKVRLLSHACIERDIPLFRVYPLYSYPVCSGCAEPSPGNKRPTQPNYTAGILLRALMAFGTILLIFSLEGLCAVVAGTT